MTRTLQKGRPAFDEDVWDLSALQGQALYISGSRPGFVAHTGATRFQHPLCRHVCGFLYLVRAAGIQLPYHPEIGASILCEPAYAAYHPLDIRRRLDLTHSLVAQHPRSV